MTITVYDQLEQGTTEWLQARAGVLTASVIGQLITPRTMKPANNDTSRALIRQLVAEQLTGWVEPTHPNRAMERGNLDEPIARETYTRHTGNTVTEVGFMTREFEHEATKFFIGYSPDGLVTNQGLIEIKSRSQKKQLETILTDEVPAENMAQIQTGLLVSDRAWCDYVSFCGGMPMYIKRVYQDAEWVRLIHEVGAMFATTAAQYRLEYAMRSAEYPATERPIHYYDDEEIY